MPIVGRFVKVDKARKKRRVSRVPVNVNSQTVEALNRATEAAVVANLSGGMRTFRRDVAKMELDTAFNAKDYRTLTQTTAWKAADAGLKKAAGRLSGLVPQTQAEVMRGVVGGTSGNAATDARFNQPIDFDAAFGRGKAKVRVPEAVAGPLSRRSDATNPRLAPHTVERRQKYMTDLFMPQREEVQRIAAQAGKSLGARMDGIRGVLKPEDKYVVGEALSYRIGLNRIQTASLDRQEAKDRKDGLTEDSIKANLEKRSEAMLQDRCKTIAVTEAKAAGGAAQIESWLAMQEQGLIGPNAEAVWHVAWEECCPDICRPVDGVHVKLGEAWTLGNGKLCSVPGTAHPRCRCLASLYDPDLDDGDTGRNLAAFPERGELDDD